MSSSVNHSIVCFSCFPFIRLFNYCESNCSTCVDSAIAFGDVSFARCSFSPLPPLVRLPPIRRNHISRVFFRHFLFLTSNENEFNGRKLIGCRKRNGSEATASASSREEPATNLFVKHEMEMGEKNIETREAEKKKINPSSSFETEREESNCTE